MTVDEAIRITNAESPLARMTMNEAQQNFVREFRAPRQRDILE
jgi:hypothetical protein